MGSASKSQIWHSLTENLLTRKILDTNFLTAQNLQKQLPLPKPKIWHFWTTIF